MYREMDPTERDRQVRQCIRWCGTPPVETPFIDPRFKDLSQDAIRMFYHLTNEMLITALTDTGDIHATTIPRVVQDLNKGADGYIHILPIDKDLEETNIFVLPVIINLDSDTKGVQQTIIAILLNLNSPQFHDGYTYTEDDFINLMYSMTDINYMYEILKKNRKVRLLTRAQKMLVK